MFIKIYVYIASYLSEEFILTILFFKVTENQKYGMIEAIAHLLNRDYTEIGQVSSHQFEFFTFFCVDLY